MSTNDDWQSADIDYQESAPPAVKFPEVGSSFEGTILAGWRQQATEYGTGDPKFYEDGQPIMQLVLLTAPDEPDEGDDWEGVRRLYIDKQGLREALKTALRAASAPKPQPGARIIIERDETDPKTNAYTFLAAYVPSEDNPRKPANAREIIDRWRHLVPAKPDERQGASARAKAEPQAKAQGSVPYLRKLREEREAVAPRDAVGFLKAKVGARSAQPGDDEPPF